MAELWDVVAAVHARQERGETVFWRRTNWTGQGYQSKPRWHRLVSIDRGLGDRQWRYTWIALCGYQFEFDGLLGKRPEVRGEVKTKGIRCSKCDQRAERAA